MTNDSNMGTPQNGSPSSTPQNTPQSTRPSSAAYVRKPRPHATQEAIDDLGTNQATTEASFTHDSGYTLNSRTPLQSRSYRRARNELKVSQGSKYGQYLSVPKGNREIFASHERQASQRKAIAGIIIVAVIVILLIVFWPK